MPRKNTPPKDEITSKLIRKGEGEKAPPFVPEYVVSLDPSMKQTAYALIQLAENGRMRVVETSICDNSKRKTTETGNGLRLIAIANGLKALCSLIPADSLVTFVKEKSFSRFNAETQAIFRVNGVLEYVLSKDIIGSQSRKLHVNPLKWIDIAPAAVKCSVTGYGKATKEQVRDSLDDYVGVREYKTLDESDAVAVGVAYLMEQKLGRPLHEPDKTTYIPPKVKRASKAKKKKEEKTIDETAIT